MNFQDKFKRKTLTTVTDETFEEAWDYINFKLVELQKKKVIRKALALFGNVLFLLTTCVMTYGAFYHITDPIIWEYLLSMKGWLGAWNIVMPFVNHPALPWFIKIFLYLIPVYVVSLLGSVLVTFVVWHVCPTKAKRKLSGDRPADAKQLLRLANEVEIRSKGGQSIDSMLAILGYMAFLVASVGGYMVFLAESGYHEQFVTILSMLIMNSTYVSMIASLLILIGGLLYGSLNLLFSNLAKPLYTTSLTLEEVQLIEDYYWLSNPEDKARIEEENQILARAKEITLARSKERSELIAEINYKNPIYGYIRKGVTLLLMIILVAVGANYLKNIDVQGLLNSWGVESTEGTGTTEE